jgi:hypothetical protein
MFLLHPYKQPGKHDHTKHSNPEGYAARKEPSEQQRPEPSTAEGS